MNKGLISCVVPTIRKAGMDLLYESFRHQTYRTIEVVLADDYYWDRNTQLKYMFDTQRIPFKHVGFKTNYRRSPESLSRNSLLFMSEGEYTYMNDDYRFVHYNALQEHMNLMMELQEEYPDETIVTVGPLEVLYIESMIQKPDTIYTMINIDELKYAQNKVILPDLRYKELDRGDLIEDFSHNNILIKTQDLLDVGGFDHMFDFGHHAEDWDIITRLKLMKDAKLFYCPDAKCYVVPHVFTPREGLWVCNDPWYARNIRLKQIENNDIRINSIIDFSVRDDELYEKDILSALRRAIRIPVEVGGTVLYRGHIRE